MQQTISRSGTTGRPPQGAESEGRAPGTSVGEDPQHPGSPSISERSVWVRPGESALCMRLFEPDAGSGSRGTVVLAPPMGREWMSAHLVIRQLALRLAAHGWTVARVAWRGAGDSSPIAEPDVVAGWADDLVETAREARRLCGTAQLPLHVIGYRLGAAVAAQAAAHFDTAVLWEPCSGRSFLRQWHRVRRVWMGDVPEADGVDLLALRLDDEQAAGLEALPDPAKHLPCADGVRLFKEDDPRRARVMYAADPLSVRVHFDVLDDLIARIPRSPLRETQPRLRGCARNEIERDGRRIVEDLVEVDPGGWPAVLVGPAEDSRDAQERLPVLMLSAASEPADCGGLWAAASREFAAEGRVCLRMDRHRSGDHSPAGQDRIPVPFSTAMAVSTRAAARWLEHRTGGPIAGIGVSAGAWALLRAMNEKALGAPAPRQELLLAVNMTDWRADMDRHAWERDVLDADAEYLESQRSRAQAKGIEGLTPRDELPEGARDWRGLTMRWTPYPVWHLLGRLRIRDLPEHLLDPAASRTRVVAMVGETDLGRLARNRVTRAMQRMRRAGHPVDIVLLAHVDHGVLTHVGQRAVIDAARRELLRAEARRAGARS